jgi:hypothetical protein
MNEQSFMAFAASFLNQLLETWQKKNREYGSPENVFAHFEEAVEFDTDDITREQTLWGNLRKHVMSVCKNANTVRSLNEEQLRYAAGEKIGDMIIYALLLGAMFKERADALQGDNSTSGVGGSVPAAYGPASVQQERSNPPMVT